MDINQLIAEKVMEFPNVLGQVWPDYSGNMLLAWKVVEKLKDVYYPFSLEQDQGELLEWMASFGETFAEETTPSMAICVAALKAIGVKID